MIQLVGKHFKLGNSVWMSRFQFNKKLSFNKTLALKTDFQEDIHVDAFDRILILESLLWV